ncbi:site-specific integrase [Rhizobacter sp. Root1221]|uniref:tyrosine-type recombinase/integrase n=1 Tax=Rhizobacter sp. Root1221 TaxID=1736433 RepID=UPI0006F299D4|nr:site-specific integrase [Rhizobacter sp. Root1221]KQV85465.1 integrase [Rhizobacter sp. Root1221]
MRHVNYTLKPITLDNAKPRDKPYSLTDGGGLLVEILPSGTKTWRYKYHLNGKREKVTLGNYPALSVKQAREKHDEMRLQVDQGHSPAKGKQTSVRSAKAAAAAAVSFRAFSARWVDETLFYRSETYRAQINRWLDTFVNPVIGDLDMPDVGAGHILEILDGLLDKPTTADGVRRVIQQVFSFAMRKLVVKANPAFGLKGAVVVPPATHHKHLTEKQLGAFLRCLDQQAGAHAATIIATKLLFLTMVRKSELLRSQHAEFDLDAGVWDIPAERMKMKKAHRVYLSRQAVDLLRQMFHFSAGSDWVFPSVFRRRVPMGDVTLNHLFSRMAYGVSGFSPHGTRGTAATLLLEHKVRKDVVELLLAHAEKDKTKAAYLHHELADERRTALQFLADRVELAASGARVIPLRAVS